MKFIRSLRVNVCFGEKSSNLSLSFKIPRLRPTTSTLINSSIHSRPTSAPTTNGEGSTKKENICSFQTEGQFRRIKKVGSINWFAHHTFLSMHTHIQINKVHSENKQILFSSAKLHAKQC